MDGHDDSEQVTGPGIGWKLVHLQHCARAARALAGDIEEALEAFDPPAINAGNGVVMSRGDLDRVAESSLALQDVVDVAAVIAGGLDAQREMVVLSAEDFAEEAERALRLGSGDRATILLSASLLSRQIGFPALADAITGEPGLVSRWGSLTVGELLTGFRDGDAGLTQLVCRESHVESRVEWSTLEVPELERLASQLRGAHDA